MDWSYGSVSPYSATSASQRPGLRTSLFTPPAIKFTNDKNGMDKIKKILKLYFVGQDTYPHYLHSSTRRPQPTRRSNKVLRSTSTAMPARATNSLSIRSPNYSFLPPRYQASISCQQLINSALCWWSWLCSGTTWMPQILRELAMSHPAAAMVGSLMLILIRRGLCWLRQIVWKR